MSPLVISAIVVAYLASVAFNYCAACGDFDWNGEHCWPLISDAQAARSDMLFCFAYSVVPIASFFAVMLGSGFYCHGFRWNIRPSTRFGGPAR